MRSNHWLYTIPLRVRSLFRRHAVERDLSDELQYHLEQKTRD
jgi:macrolide transport system ATP-binding/permease protein